jgi:hypothetical protein
MKKLILLFAVTFISLTAFCQELDNEFYFRFGYSNPSWNHFGSDKDGWADGVKKSGANFELGSIFLIPSLTQAKNMAFGINVDYLYSNYNKFAIKDDEDGFNLAIFRLGSKIGPSFTYSPAEKVAFDVYVKADFAWATAAVPYEDKIKDEDDYYAAYAAVGLSTGLNFRYGILMLGVEFNTISTELESDEYKGVYFQEMIEGVVGDSDPGKKTKLPNLNFTIGMSF